MKQKMWLCRDSDGGYHMFPIKDEPWWNNGWEFWSCINAAFLTYLCPRITKKWLGLKKHLPKGEKGICQIELEVKCKVLK